jgi:hypothetical protein
LVVRAAARIAAQWNPFGAVEKILQFIGTGNNRVINQVLEPWGRLGDYEQYARDVLSEIDFGRLTVDLQSGRRIEHIGHLDTITKLVLRNDLRDLTPLADLPRLRRLTLRDNTRTDLQSLSGSQSLRVLVLDRCSSMSDARPINLAPLGCLRLRRLVVSGMITAKVSLASLAGVELDSLHLSGVVLRGSPVLPPGLRVRHLCLTGRRCPSPRDTGPGNPSQVDFTGLQEVRSIILSWLPNDNEMAMLAELPRLRRLVLWQVPPHAPARALRGVEVMVVHSKCPQAAAS